MISKISYFQQRFDTSLLLFLKNTVYNHNQFLIVFFIFIVSATLTTLARAEISFTESTEEAGLTYTGPTWGAQWADYDGDGWPDIFVTNHESKVPSLYLNKQDGTFEQLPDSIWDKPAYPCDTHGAGWADFDNDGDQDVYISAGTWNHYNHFYINDNGGLYESADAYGISYILNRGRMPLWLDFDNDGFLDIFVNGYSMGGEGYAAFFQQNATGFENVNSLVGFEEQNVTYSVMSDITGDGILDVISTDDSAPFPTHVFDITTLPFTNVRDQIFSLDTGYGMDAAFADVNGDLLPDLYTPKSGGGDQVEQVTSTRVAAAIMTERCGCQKGITFQTTGNLTLLFSLRLSYADHPIRIGSSGLLAANFEVTLDPDDPRIWGFAPRIPVYLELSPNDDRVVGMPSYNPGVDDGVYIGFNRNTNEWTIVSSVPTDESFQCRFIAQTDGSQITNVTHLNLNTFDPAVDALYIHNGVQLENRTSQSGINKHLAGRSVVIADFDNDMDQDIYVVNALLVENTPNILYENNGAGYFTEVLDAGGAAGTSLGIGDHVVTADYNRDGFLDLFVTNGRYPPPFDHLGPIQLFKNNGNNNHWIEIDLEGTLSNRDGIGASVLVTAGGLTQLREQNAGMHRDSQNHTRIHFGLGQNITIQRLEVYWPSGIVQVLENISADQILRVVESSSGSQPPVASFTADPTSGEEPLDVNFDASWSYDDGSIVSYAWDFGDGTGSGITPSHTYNLPGIYNVTLTVTDDDGFTDTANQNITVGSSNMCNPYGEPSYDPAAEDGIFLWQEGNVWHLRAVAGLSGWQRYTGSIVSDMDFDSVTPVNLEPNDNLDTSDPQEIIFDMQMSEPWYDGIDFEVPAGATVYVDVQVTSGNADNLVFIGGNQCPIAQLPYQLPSASNTLPVASFTADPTSGEEPLDVNFDASGSSDDGLIVSYAWDFGDGTGSGVTTSHTYNSPGIYNVILTVTDDDGFTDTANQNITVGSSNMCNPYGEPSYDPAAEDGIFLWQEGNVWHLRAVAGLSGWQRYTGSIVSDMDFDSVTPVSLEPNDNLDTSDSQEIIFDMQMSEPWYDGIDFEVPAGATVYFDVQVTSGNADDLVFIGGNQCPIDLLPYLLP
ncbi:PKD domain-containing protein [Desulfogranum marinum]|uniref:PKD domain-containing protein n=1 Tax=Desulfogranum marinum TaxID=453220 RepID=UPI0019625FF8|nr:PKD domain-containing protein [Desulfogranum marinum]MBM9513505.1 VCBS repeat-containing protein [Desulfogranum marinum]